MTPQHISDEAPTHRTHVKVTAIYTSTADDRHFTVDDHQTVHHVIQEAYAKLSESPRPGDAYYRQGEPRIDLAPYLNATLKQMADQRLLLHNGRGELELIFDIDTQAGGATR